MLKNSKLCAQFTNKNMLFVCVILLLTIALLLVPTGFEKELYGESVKVEVKRADNSDVRQHGIIRTGDQHLEVTILSGSFEGRSATAVNHLIGQLEIDKIYAPGDKALALIDSSSGELIKITMQDHYRVHVEAVLMALFAVLLICYAGITGLKTLLSFVFSAVAIWKILLPGLLRGWEPIVTSVCISALLCFVIIFLVSGFDRKGFIAFFGAMLGVLFTCVVSIVFGKLFNIHGAVKPFSETLLYSGFGHLNITGFFIGGIFLASSGAVMDLAMDIASGMNELKRKKPDISRRELVHSGNAIGRMVVGTMTTTLLLAYTGSFTSLLMVFIA